MPYATEQLIKDEYGSLNVDKWADLNNNGNAGEITARIGVAVTRAENKINGMLRGGRYTVPFTDPVDGLIEEIAIKLAANYIYESRGITSDLETNHDLILHKREAINMIVQIRKGILNLDADTTKNNIEAGFSDA